MVGIAGAGFVQDEDNGKVWWGRSIDGDTFRLVEAWCEDEGYVVHVDIADVLPQADLRPYMEALAEMNEHMESRISAP